MRSLHATILRLADKDANRFEKGAFEVAAVTGGTPKVWSAQQLLIEDAGPGLHLYYLHGGAVMELRAGDGDYRELAQWLATLAATAKVQLEDTQGSSQDRSNFARLVCKVLNGAGVACTTRGEAVHVHGGPDDVQRATELICSKRAARTLGWYFGAPRNTQRASM